MSVGGALTNPRGAVRSGIGFVQDTSALAAAVQQEAEREMQQQGGAKSVLLPHALPVEVLNRFIARYGDYQIGFLKASSKSHVLYDAHRHMAINAMLDKASRLTERVTIVGDALFQAGTRDMMNVHLEMDPNSDYAVHAHHEAAAQFMKAQRSREFIYQKFGYTLAPRAYQLYKMQKALKVCTSGDACGEYAEFLGVDGSAHFLSPNQMATAMYDCGAVTGQFILPYNPEMFKETCGQLDDESGVGYSVDSRNVYLHYPEGVQGVSYMPVVEYFEWLIRSYVCVLADGEEVWYNMELTNYAAPFIACDMVRITGKPPPGPTLHAVDMPWAEGKLVVEYMTLESIRAAPTRPESWKKASQIVDRHEMEKVYRYAIGLEQSLFSMDKVVERVSKMNGRVIQTGMSVRIYAPLAPTVARDLAWQVYSRAFVDRYKMGTLGAVLAADLDKARKFATASRLEKLGAVLMGLVVSGDGFLSRIVDSVHNGLDKWHAAVSSRLIVDKPEFAPAARFVLLRDYATWKMSLLTRAYQSMKMGGVTCRGVKGARRVAAAWGSISPDYLKVNVKGTYRCEPLGELHERLVDTSLPVETGGKVDELTRLMVGANFSSRGDTDRFVNEVVGRDTSYVGDDLASEASDDMDGECGFVEVNEVMEQIFPGMMEQNFEQDLSSMAYDPQERDIDAEYAQYPLVAPTPRNAVVYKSKLNGYNVEKKVQTVGDTITAAQGRVLAAPQLRELHDEMAMAQAAWANLRSEYMRPEADEMIESYRSDRVRLEKEVYEQWAQKARPENVAKVMIKVRENLAALEETEPWIYDILLKSDAKPPLSTKPLREVVAPQLIVMNEKLVSSLFSSIFRVMSRRFEALLGPSVMVNLLKDTDAIAAHMAANHPWGEEVNFLENDYSKFDKSQDRFTFMVMKLILDDLGFDEAMLDMWVDANDRCVLRSFSLGIMLTVFYGNKSGGPATAFQNAIMNMVSVAYAYKGTDVVWAVFMGDDSLVACRHYVADQRALDTLAKVFNFEAKFFILRHPYFVSCFVVFDEQTNRVYMVPDPVKRVQKWSVSVPARDPQWEDKFRSAHETLWFYRRKRLWPWLIRGVRERYAVAYDVNVSSICEAIGWYSSSGQKFRTLYETETSCRPATEVSVW